MTSGELKPDEERTMQTINFKLNGEQKELLVPSHRLLLDLLRDVLEMTGTKEGCGTGDCGACTVILNGRPVNSCLIFAGELEGADVTTIEGLRNKGALHPVQKAFVKEGGVQCGYCTPGMIMMAVALLEENQNPTTDEIRFALSGNLCRCTGYTKIVNSVRSAADEIRYQARKWDLSNREY